MLNIYVLIGCWLNKWCTWVRIETHDFWKTGNRAAAVFAPSTCPTLSFIPGCMQGVCPGMCHNCDQVLLLSFWPPIPMLSMLGIQREGQHVGWIIEIVNVYCSSSICHDLLACILSTRTYEPCKHKLAEFVFCWLTYILRVEWVLTCGVCVVAITVSRLPTCRKRDLSTTACMNWLCSTPFNRRCLNVFGKSPLTTWSTIQIVTLRRTS